jgi:hypothetical protein
MSDYLAAQTAYHLTTTRAEVITTMSKAGARKFRHGAANARKIRTERSGGFVDSETLFDGNTPTLLGRMRKICSA